MAASRLIKVTPCASLWQSLGMARNTIIQSAVWPGRIMITWLDNPVPRRRGACLDHDFTKCAEGPNDTFWWAAAAGNVV